MEGMALQNSSDGKIGALKDAITRYGDIRILRAGGCKPATRPDQRRNPHLIKTDEQ